MEKIDLTLDSIFAGDENPSGAITGSVYRSLAPHDPRDGADTIGSIKKAGSVRIESDGHVTKWPCANKAMREQIKRENIVVAAWKSGEKFVIV